MFGFLFQNVYFTFSFQSTFIIFLQIIHTHLLCRNCSCKKDKQRKNMFKVQGLKFKVRHAVLSRAAAGMCPRRMEMRRASSQAPR